MRTFAGSSRWIRPGWVLALLGAAASLAPARAQSVVQGSVKVNQARPLTDAVVRAREAGTGKVHVTQLDHQGNYRIQGLKEKQYLLEVEKNGRSLYMGIIDVKGANTRKDVHLVDPTAKTAAPLQAAKKRKQSAGP